MPASPPWATRLLTIVGAEVTHISLQHAPLAFYDGDHAARPELAESAITLKRPGDRHGEVFITSPE